MVVVIVLAVSLGLFLTFAGQASGTEIGAGIPVACLIAAFAGLRHRGQTRSLRLGAPWHRVLLKPLAALIKNSMRVGGMLLRAIVSPKRAVAGTIDRQPFRPGRDRPADAGRRALVTLASSFAPNGFVLDIPPSVILGDAEVLLMHRLAPSPPVPVRRFMRHHSRVGPTG